MKFQNPWKTTLTSSEEKLLHTQLKTSRKNPSNKDLIEVKLEIQNASKFIPPNSNSNLKNSKIPKSIKTKQGSSSQIPQRNRSLNSIELEIREMELLRIMKQKNFIGFSKFVTQRTQPAIFNEWHEQIIFKHELDKERREMLRKDLDHHPDLTFKPEINQKSKTLALERKKKLKSDYFPVQNKTERLFEAKNGFENKVEKVFVQNDFKNHMTKINNWNQKSNNKKLMETISSLTKTQEINKGDKSTLDEDLFNGKINRKLITKKLKDDHFILTGATALHPHLDGFFDTTKLLNSNVAA